MSNDIFINLALDTALKKYETLIETNDYNISKDFLVYVIGTLIYIYGEENVLGLYNKHDELSFTYLLKKYDVDKYYADKFLTDLDRFYSIEINNNAYNRKEKNPYFIYIQEDLIQMFLAKYKENSYDKKKIDKFRDLLFTPINNDPFMQEYNQKMADDQNYILDYYNSQIFALNNKLEFTLERQNKISQSVYDKFNLTKDKIDSLSFKELESINNKIYSYFNVSPIDVDVNEKILNKMKKMDITKLSNDLNKSNMTKLIIFGIIFLVVVIIAIFIGIKLVGK